MAELHIIIQYRSLNCGEKCLYSKKNFYAGVYNAVNNFTPHYCTIQESTRNEVAVLHIILYNNLHCGVVAVLHIIVLWKNLQHCVETVLYKNLQRGVVPLVR